MSTFEPPGEPLGSESVSPVIDAAGSAVMLSTSRKGGWVLAITIIAVLTVITGCLMVVAL